MHILVIREDYVFPSVVACLDAPYPSLFPNFSHFRSTFDQNNRLNPKLREAAIAQDPVWFLKKETGEVSRTWGKKK